jgi:hypothetical protein
MSHDRTVEQWVKEVEHITGVKVRFRRFPFYGHYLEDSETGNTYPLGAATRGTLLDPREQESICHSLGREAWIILLGLDPPKNED